MSETSTTLNKLAEGLRKRADAYEQPYPDRDGFLRSPSYAISTTLREVSYQLNLVADEADRDDPRAGLAPRMD